jgi:hypothetical protein
MIILQVLLEVVVDLVEVHQDTVMEELFLGDLGHQGKGITAVEGVGNTILAGVEALEEKVTILPTNLTVVMVR